MNIKNLFDKYDVPVPRYTSYPTVPFWKNNLSRETWEIHLNDSLQDVNTSWGLYIHLPFCESLCSFCACNNVITKNHSVEERYVKAIEKEWRLYLNNAPAFKKTTIKQIHLGGGSPTFFSPLNLQNLLEPIFSELKIDCKTFEGAIEVDPRRCTRDQLKLLRDFGFNRISLGVQDLDHNVQKNVNRVQPFEVVQDCVATARELGYQSINFDLIYGLPGQTTQSIKQTTLAVIGLKPDRIALYSLANVPWMKPAHKKFKNMEMKLGKEKRELFETAKEIFLDNEYVELGIDHFARPTDSIALAKTQNTLHRNFMGYTEYATNIILGLGVSAISETPYSYQQNAKDLNEYYRSLEENNELPLYRGHVFDETDKKIKSYILNIMTRNWTDYQEGEIHKENFFEMIDDGLLEFNNNKLVLTKTGVPFARHVCNKLDQYILKSDVNNRFSSGV